MPIFLIIDVALPLGIVAIANEDNIIEVAYNNEQLQHAKWLHVTIEKLLLNNNLKPKDINVVAVTNGPGSYTGIRIGLAAAKGFCFALNIPLILINNLEAIARGNKKLGKKYYFPMIDARRNEVFNTSFDMHFSLLEPNSSTIIEKNTYAEITNLEDVLFCGTASQKCQVITGIDAKYFVYNDYNINILHNICILNYKNKNFPPLNTAIANYAKNFFLIK